MLPAITEGPGVAPTPWTIGTRVEITRSTSPLFLGVRGTISRVLQELTDGEPAELEIALDRYSPDKSTPDHEGWERYDPFLPDALVHRHTQLAVRREQCRLLDLVELVGEIE